MKVIVVKTARVKFFLDQRCFTHPMLVKFSSRHVPVSDVVRVPHFAAPHDEDKTPPHQELTALLDEKLKLRKRARWTSQDWCHYCKIGGDLICCNCCPRVYHAECLNLKVVPKGFWRCPQHVCAACGRNQSQCGSLFRCVDCPCGNTFVFLSQGRLKFLTLSQLTVRIICQQITKYRTRVLFSKNAVPSLFRTVCKWERNLKQVAGFSVTAKSLFITCSAFCDRRYENYLHGNNVRERNIESSDYADAKKRN